MNIRQSLQQSSETRYPVDSYIRNRSRITHVLPSQSTPLRPHKVTGGMLSLTSDMGEGHFADHARDHAVIPIASSSELPAILEPPNAPLEDQLARKRALSRSAPVPQAKVARKGTRSCRKCDKGEECNGKNGVALCPNPCKDCGKKDCLGRNKNRPNRPCTEGWIGVAEDRFQTGKRQASKTG